MTESAAKSAPTAGTRAEDGFICTGIALSGLPQNTSRCVVVEDVGMVIWRRSDKSSSAVHGSHFYALSATCYHMGGPLKDAPIEEIPDYGSVVTCPWHRYKITLATGEGLYQPALGKWATKGKKQRTHEVQVRDGLVWVKVSKAAESKEELPSDFYTKKANELKLLQGFLVIPSDGSAAKICAEDDDESGAAEAAGSASSAGAGAGAGASARSGGGATASASSAVKSLLSALRISADDSSAAAAKSGSAASGAGGGAAAATQTGAADADSAKAKGSDADLGWV